MATIERPSTPSAAVPRAPRYDPAEIEPRWQRTWEAARLHETDLHDATRPPFYMLTMYPYPSGDIHVGHWYAMTPSDAIARYRRMNGVNVFFPIGFDAFGLPAENAAIERGIHPYGWTMGNIERMRAQLRQMGNSFDWSAEVVTCEPEYYRWNQWLFLKFLEMGLAYRAMAPVDWCPKDQATLAREQVEGADRRCWRCGTPVVKRDLEQWFFRITAYADELLDFSGIDWPEPVRVMQTNWIGRSEGAEVVFTTALDAHQPGGDELRVFTTRPDTLWGATFMVLAPEHALVPKLTHPDRTAEVDAYVLQARRETEIERLSTERAKTGVFTGSYAVNPVNGERIPIWIADYVLATYGTGAIMAVPAHDQRDFDFALKFGLPILPVIGRPDRLTKSYAPAGTMADGFAEALRAEGIPFEAEDDGALRVAIPPERVDRYVELARRFVRPDSWNEVIGTRWAFVFADAVETWDSLAAEARILARCHALEPGVRERRTVMEMLWGVPFYRDALYHHDHGTMIGSGVLTGTPGDEAGRRTTDWLAARGAGKAAVSYRIRDWLISRQRYWGTPIPVVYCERCGTVPVPEDQLPVLLPEDAEYRPTGESPLKYHERFLSTTCPRCDGPATRETDTMDTFIDSSWYWFRYLSPRRGASAVDAEMVGRWTPVHQYTGGAEHAVMHLLYSRFFTKAMADVGLFEQREPFLRLFNQGQILGADGERMSKSRGNVENPDDYIGRYGTDAVRLFLMFIGPWDQGGAWSAHGIGGVSRFLHRAWTVALDPHGVEPGDPGAGRLPAGESAVDAERRLRTVAHRTLRTVTGEYEGYRFNTMVAHLMELTNLLMRYRGTEVAGGAAWDEAIRLLLLMLAPAAPQVTEELWQRAALGADPAAGGSASDGWTPDRSIHRQAWPAFDPALAAEEEIELPIQVNGKLRDRVTVAAGTPQAEIEALVLARPKVVAALHGAAPKRVIHVPGRLVNIVAP